VIIDFGHIILPTGLLSPVKEEALSLINMYQAPRPNMRKVYDDETSQVRRGEIILLCMTMCTVVDVEVYSSPFGIHNWKYIICKNKKKETR
jgi:hypothetical protein